MLSQNLKAKLSIAFSLDEQQRFGFFLIFIFIIGVRFSFSFAQINLGGFIVVFYLCGIFYFLFQRDDLFRYVNLVVLLFLVG